VRYAPFAAALLVACCGATPLVAQDEIRVLSPRADAIAVTIYRDGFALVTERRTVDLPAAAVTLVIQDVVETLLPQSAVIDELGRPLAESNFDFDRLTPATLLARSIGSAVTVTRTDPTTGRVTRTPATLVAAGEGVILATPGGREALYCSGLPERLELDTLPEGLVAEPQLSVRLAAGPAGPRTVEVSYLAHGFGWSSDYVAHLNERSDRLSLVGWATLTNGTDRAFSEAEVQLVAGVLNVLPAEEGGSAAPPELSGGRGAAMDARAERIDREAAAAAALLRECFVTELPERSREPERLFRLDMTLPMAARSLELEEIFLTAARAEREELGDYQLYRLPWRTDLGARQTKQVLFLERPAVEVERFYSVRLDTFSGETAEEVAVPELTLRFENVERDGLGEPLPRGIVRVFEPYSGREVFAGEAEIGDRPVGLPVELVIGRAQNVLLETASDWRQERGARWTVATEHRIVNRKAAPIDVEIRHAIDGYLTDARVNRTSKPMRRKYGDFAWRFVVPPGEETLRYELSARAPR
jgi:hypothetical protein